jgi:hypothetical protein
LTWGGRVAWILRLVKIEAEGDWQCTDIMEINKPDDLGDIADLGLTLAEGKLLLAGCSATIWMRSATIRMTICGRGSWMIVAERQEGKSFFLPRSDNQDEALIVAREGGRPGPLERSMAARLR